MLICVCVCVYTHDYKHNEQNEKYKICNRKSFNFGKTKERRNATTNLEVSFLVFQTHSEQMSKKTFVARVCFVTDFVKVHEVVNLIHCYLILQIHCS